MIPADLLSVDLADTAARLQSGQQPFAYATIIRTAGTTAAKPGAKALIDSQGAIVGGFLGGGCTRGAVKRAALAALETGTPQLISVTPEDEITKKGLTPGAEVEGVTYARNGCPSRGTIDIFIEPCLPAPEVVIMGASPVAEALATLAPVMSWAVTRDDIDPTPQPRTRAIVIATQGQGDLAALTAALAAEVDHIAFVGSGKKFAALSEKLQKAGHSSEQINRITAPAGAKIGAVTPEEIALSIFAQLIQLHRQTIGQSKRQADVADG